jgi:hypothetical protein
MFMANNLKKATLIKNKLKMKSNEEYLKELFCSTLLKSMEGASVVQAIKEANLAVNAFSEQFQSKEILKPLDYKYIRIWNPEQEVAVLNGVVKMRKYRFKGCSLDYSLQKIPSIELGGFPYWICINNDGTIQIETKNPN